MPFDYKKEYKAFYLPPKTPGIIEIPPMHFVAVRGQGNPNEEGGAYHQAVGILYAMAFGGRRAKRASTMGTSPRSNGSRSSACPIL